MGGTLVDAGEGNGSGAESESESNEKLADDHGEDNARETAMEHCRDT